MTKERLFIVDIVNKETGNLVMRFKANVVDKKQKSGKFGGNVIETLFTDAFVIEKPYPYMSLNKKLLEQKIKKSLNGNN